MAKREEEAYGCVEAPSYIVKAKRRGKVGGGGG